MVGKRKENYCVVLLILTTSNPLVQARRRATSIDGKKGDGIDPARIPALEDGMKEAEKGYHLLLLLAYWLHSRWAETTNWMRSAIAMDVYWVPDSVSFEFRESRTLKRHVRDVKASIELSLKCSSSTCNPHICTRSFNGITLHYFHTISINIRKGIVIDTLCWDCQKSKPKEYHSLPVCLPGLRTYLFIIPRLLFAKMLIHRLLSLIHRCLGTHTIHADVFTLIPGAIKIWRKLDEQNSWIN